MGKINAIARIQEFLNWWIRGLMYLIPVSLLRVLNPPTDRITIEFDEQRVILRRYPDSLLEKLDERSFRIEGDEIEKTRILNWVNDRLIEKAKVILLIPNNKILEKTLILPLAAKENLRQVLGFEMDRRTPFSADQVYFDYLIGDVNTAKSQFKIQLFVTPRQYIDNTLETLHSWNISPSAISISDKKDKLNLLPEEKRPKQNNRHAIQSSLILTTITCCLFMTVLYIPLLKQERVLTELEGEVAKSRIVATKAQALKKQRDDAIEKYLFLVNKRNNQIPSINILNELTRLIPDDTWLTRFTLMKGEIQIQGESSSASALIHTIEGSDYFSDARFKSPITRNQSTNKDKFNLSANLLEEQQG